ncbi:hypothetical protein HMPREF9969_0953 [Prevotella sp. oral taxon 306 str. F0472]|nr:hypothetical protein HMPREF9969_0953 [Prevotella sp. oral taxon 306 str. F0472]
MKKRSYYLVKELNLKFLLQGNIFTMTLKQAKCHCLMAIKKNETFARIYID